MGRADERQFSPSTARNRSPIMEVLERVLPAQARVLEIASGSGEHAVFFARVLPGLIWQTSDPDAAARASIAGWIASEGLANALPPLALDVCRDDDWGRFDAVVAINMIHIAPWEATRALFAGARRAQSRIVFLYGPFKRSGAHTAPSNAAFDDWLKARDPKSGVRDLDDVVREAEAESFHLGEIVEMPASNLSAIFNLSNP